MRVSFICNDCKKFVSCQEDPHHELNCGAKYQILNNPFRKKHVNFGTVIHAGFNTSLGQEILGKSHIKEIEKRRDLICMDYREHAQEVEHKKKIIDAEKSEKFKERVVEGVYKRRLVRGEI